MTNSEAQVHRDGLVLITARTSDPEGTLEGFQGVFSTPSGEDYFGIAWHPEGETLPAGATYVEPSQVPEAFRDAPDAASFSIFCPVSGDVLPEAIEGGPDEALECFDVLGIRVGDPDKRKAPHMVQGLAVEHFVVLISGTFPEAFEADEEEKLRFAAAFLDDACGANLAEAEESGGFYLTLLHVSDVIEDTELLSQLLQQTAYADQEWGDRLFVSSPVFELHEPFKDIGACLIAVPPAG